MSSLERGHGFRAHSSYVAPEAEVLVTYLEEQFLQSRFNASNNETLSRGLDEDFD